MLANQQKVWDSLGNQLPTTVNSWDERRKGVQRVGSCSWCLRDGLNSSLHFERPSQKVRNWVFPSLEHPATVGYKLCSL